MTERPTALLSWINQVATITIDWSQCVEPDGLDVARDIDRKILEISNNRAEFLALRSPSDNFGPSNSAMQTPSSGFIMDPTWLQCINNLLHLEIPIAVAASGKISDFGALLSISSDFLIVSKNSYFNISRRYLRTFSDCEISSASSRMKRVLSRAEHLAQLDGSFSAALAYQSGWIYQFYPVEDLSLGIEELARRLCTKSETSFGIFRDLFDIAQSLSPVETLELEERLNREIRR